MRIIANSIKDQLIPQVPSKKTPKQMYDALSRMYEGKNINIKMNLRTQLKGTRMSKGEFVQYYLTRISQIKEKLSAIGDTLDEDELVMSLTLLSMASLYLGTHSSKLCVLEEKV